MEKQIVSFATKQLKTCRSACQAIRATAFKFKKVKRSVVIDALVQGCGLNAGTVRTQVQYGRE